MYTLSKDTKMTSRICACNKAVESQCLDCVKFKVFNPNFRVDAPPWRRDTTDIQKMIHQEMRESCSDAMREDEKEPS